MSLFLKAHTRGVDLPRLDAVAAGSIGCLWTDTRSRLTIGRKSFFGTFAIKCHPAVALGIHAFEEPLNNEGIIFLFQTERFHELDLTSSLLFSSHLVVKAFSSILHTYLIDYYKTYIPCFRSFSSPLTLCSQLSFDPYTPIPKHIRPGIKYTCPNRHALAPSMGSNSNSGRMPARQVRL